MPGDTSAPEADASWDHAEIKTRRLTNRQRRGAPRLTSAERSPYFFASLMVTRGKSANFTVRLFTAERMVLV